MFKKETNNCFLTNSFGLNNKQLGDGLGAVKYSNKYFTISMDFSIKTKWTI